MGFGRSVVQFFAFFTGGVIGIVGMNMAIRSVFGS